MIFLENCPVIILLNEDVLDFSTQFTLPSQIYAQADSAITNKGVQRTHNFSIEEDSLSCLRDLTSLSMMCKVIIKNLKKYWQKICEYFH